MRYGGKHDSISLNLPSTHNHISCRLTLSASSPETKAFAEDVDAGLDCRNRAV